MKKLISILYFLAALVPLAQPAVALAEPTPANPADQNSIFNDTVWYKMAGENCSESQAESGGTSGNKTIVLDPGHAGANTIEVDPESGIKTQESGGATGEMQNMWDTAQIIKARLQKEGYKVILTKSGEADKVGLLTKVNRANQANAAIAVSLHYTGNWRFGVANNHFGVTPQEVGRYRQNNGDGKKKTFTDSALAQKSQQYAKIMAAERSKTGDTVNVAPLDQSFPPGRTDVLAHGDISMVQLFGKVPWVYNETGSIGFDKGEYADGIASGIEKAIPISGGVSAATTSATTATGNSNLDYAGRPILNQGQLKAIKAQQSTYQQAAQQVGIPWQLLAAIHYRETSLSLDSPNADGLYQINAVTGGGHYPVGPVSAQEFLRESIDAGNVLKRKDSKISAQPQPATVKNTIYGYNGIPGDTYPTQAQKLGFNKDTQYYEGSPYVMNMADAKRDPHIASVANSGNWLQARSSTTFSPANTAYYGAYVVYASLTGTTLGGGGSCSSGSVNCPASSAEPSTANLSQVRQNIVCVAKHELSLWDSGQMKPGTDYYKYEGSVNPKRPEPWCADFVSWVYKQAGYPLGPASSTGEDWDIPWTGNLRVPPQSASKFKMHPASGYTPKPGDIAIHYDPSKDDPWYHTNIVSAVNGSKIWLIGGNQSGPVNGPQDGKVTLYGPFDSPSADNIKYYTGPD